MSKALAELTREAMELPYRQRLALAESLLESAETDPAAEAAWDAEILQWLRGVEEGSAAAGVAYADVLRAAELRLTT